jgi:hypothetical protein
MMTMYIVQSLPQMTKSNLVDQEKNMQAVGDHALHNPWTSRETVSCITTQYLCYCLSCMDITAVQMTH